MMKKTKFLLLDQPLGEANTTGLNGVELEQPVLIEDLDSGPKDFTNKA